MSDRLNELRRQRALLQEHLAWLDREIAAAEISAGQTASPAAHQSIAATIDSARGRVTPRAPSAIAGAHIGPAATPGPSSTTEALFDQYRIEPANVKADVRKGCFLYFALALVLLGLGVTGLWFAFRR